MKRWTLKLALCLLAGAVVTWAVAWGCALSGSPCRSFEDVSGSTTPPSAFPEVPREWAVRDPSGRVVVNWFEDRSLGYTARGCHVAGFDGDGRLEFRNVKQQFVAGLPLAALGCESVVLGSRETAAGTTVPQTVWLNAGFVAPQWLSKGTAARPIVYVPCRILPIGFALDTLLYGGVVLGVVEGVGFRAAVEEDRSGALPSCGYDRRGLAGSAAAACPECGTV